MIKITHKDEDKTVSITKWSIVNGVMKLQTQVGHAKPVIRLVDELALQEAIWNIEDWFAPMPDSVIVTSETKEDAYWIEELLKRVA